MALGQPAAARRVTRTVSCGVIVTDGHRVVLGHATRTPRWDIPKGIAEPGETLQDAARRELLEETGLAASPNDLSSLGLHRYLASKDLALFAWLLPELPNTLVLRCKSMVGTGRTAFPEFDRFALSEWPTALGQVGRSMAATLGPVAVAQGWMPPHG